MTHGLGFFRRRNISEGGRHLGIPFDIRTLRITSHPITHTHARTHARTHAPIHPHIHTHMLLHKETSAHCRRYCTHVEHKQRQIETCMSPPISKCIPTCHMPHHPISPIPPAPFPKAPSQHPCPHLSEEAIPHSGEGFACKGLLEVLVSLGAFQRAHRPRPRRCHRNVTSSLQSLECGHAHACYRLFGSAHGHAQHFVVVFFLVKRMQKSKNKNKK